MFMLISNEPVKVTDLRLMLNGSLVTEMENNSFSESNKNLGHSIKGDISSVKYILLDFTKYLSFSEVQKYKSC